LPGALTALYITGVFQIQLNKCCCAARLINATESTETQKKIQKTVILCFLWHFFSLRAITGYCSSFAAALPGEFEMPLYHLKVKNSITFINHTKTNNMQFAVKVFSGIAVVIHLFACSQNNNPAPQADAATAESKKQIAAMLDSFNAAAARAEYSTYFNYFAADATFNGTDATENWNKKAFMLWAKPYFDKKTTWNFKSIDRHIYFGKYPDIAWFDELLSTQMKICRGSGVVVKAGNEWKVQQYVLSATVPNSQLDSVIKMKAAEEDSLISKLTGK
jgi:SnoaL-like domain